MMSSRYILRFHCPFIEDTRTPVLLLSSVPMGKVNGVATIHNLPLLVLQSVVQTNGVNDLIHRLRLIRTRSKEWGLRTVNGIEINPPRLSLVSRNVRVTMLGVMNRTVSIALNGIHRITTWFKYNHRLPTRNTHLLVTLTNSSEADSPCWEKYREDRSSIEYINNSYVLSVEKVCIDVPNDTTRYSDCLFPFNLTHRPFLAGNISKSCCAKRSKIFLRWNRICATWLFSRPI